VSRVKGLRSWSFGLAAAVLAGGLGTGCVTPGSAISPPGTPAREPGVAAGFRSLAPRQALHVLSRLTFGPRPGDIESLQRIGIAAYVGQQLNPGSIDDRPVDTALADLSTLTMPTASLLRDYPRPQPAAAGQVDAPVMTAPAKRPAVVLMELQAARMVRAVVSERQLQEVMVDFWMNHFNVFVYKGEILWYLTSYERDAIRPHALGDFRALLGATAHHPAMLYYLDNWQSRKDTAGKPGLNENYARELMELHTLGVDGGYTQRDVREVARIFTGWTIDRPREEGRFVFRPQLHDTAEKVVLGHRFGAGAGIEEGEQVLDLLARHPATSRFLARKLLRRFVTDEPPNDLVEGTAAVFRQTGGDIRATLRAIFTSAAFMTEGAYRGKVKKPTEFVVSAVRALGGRVDTRGGLELARAAARIGEGLYQAQPPTGYDDRVEAWVNAGSLLGRMNFALAVANRQVPGVVVDLDGLTAGTDRRKPDAVLARLLSVILNDQVSDQTRAVLTRQLQDPRIIRSTPDDQRDLRWADTDVAALAALVLGSPEFQRR
jgi:uncharacterized protein (DUF1800 family)